MYIEPKIEDNRGFLVQDIVKSNNPFLETKQTPPSSLNQHSNYGNELLGFNFTPGQTTPPITTNPSPSNIYFNFGQPSNNTTGTTSTGSLNNPPQTNNSFFNTTNYNSQPTFNNQQTSFNTQPTYNTQQTTFNTQQTTFNSQQPTFNSNNQFNFNTTTTTTSTSQSGSSLFDNHQYTNLFGSNNTTSTTTSNNDPFKELFSMARGEMMSGTSSGSGGSSNPFTPNSQMVNPQTSTYKNPFL